MPASSRTRCRAASPDALKGFRLGRAPPSLSGDRESTKGGQSPVIVLADAWIGLVASWHPCILIAVSSPVANVETITLRPFEDSSGLLEDTNKLQERARRDGFLFFRSLLDRTQILALRRQALAVLRRHGLLRADSGELSGELDVAELQRISAEQLRLDIGVTSAMYVELQRLPLLHRLPHDPSLLQVFQALLSAEVFVHPRHIMRAFTPHPAISPTPPHQDFPLVQGSTDTWTCWFPIGDCPKSLGPLVVLAGSHRNGYLPVVKGQGAGGLVAQLCPNEDDWVGGDFLAGDVLVFSCFTVHRALAPVVRDQVRLSLDVRYQRVTEPVEARSLTNHADCSWEEIYSGWPEEDWDLKYYWEGQPLIFSSWDAALVQSGRRRIC